MNKQEYLLQCLQEECSEIIKLVSKSNRFGLDSNNLGEMRFTNLQLINKEICDFIAVLEELQSLGINIEFGNRRNIENKKIRLWESMKQSRFAGTLQDGE